MKDSWEIEREGTSGVKARLATVEDVPQLLELCRLFCSESLLGWDFFPEVAQNTFETLIATDHTATIVVGDEDIMGFVNVMGGRDYCIQEIGFIEKFYVAPNARGTPVARTLVKAAVDWFVARGCAEAFATATANISASQDKQFENLFAKFGFVPCGPTLMKEIING